MIGQFVRGAVNGADMNGRLQQSELGEELADSLLKTDCGGQVNAGGGFVVGAEDAAENAGRAFVQRFVQLGVHGEGEAAAVGELCAATFDAADGGIDETVRRQRG